MKILTQEAKQLIKSHEEDELMTISFALGLCGGRVRVGTDFIDPHAWSVGQLCRHYVNLGNIKTSVTYSTAKLLDPAIKDLADHIKTRGLTLFTKCITDSDDVSTVSDWVDKCEVKDSVIVKLMECVLRDERTGEDDDETLFDASEAHQARFDVYMKDRHSGIAEFLVGAWQSL